MPISAYDADMARAATTTDAFNAVAEPRRRRILDVLAAADRGELPVNDLVRAVDMTQPQVSKHLRVLREVGAVQVRGAGRQRLYRLDGRALKPIHDWVKNYERTWEERFGLLDGVLDDLVQAEAAEQTDPTLPTLQIDRPEETEDGRDHRDRQGDAPERPADPDHP
jgi:DNA-binding transcriptional ArsR family regulator